MTKKQEQCQSCWWVCGLTSIKEIPFAHIENPWMRIGRNERKMGLVGDSLADDRLLNSICCVRKEIIQMDSIEWFFVDEMFDDLEKD